MFRGLVYAESDEDFQRSLRMLRNNPTYKKYLKYQNYLEKVLLRRDEWCLEFRLRECLPTNCVNTTNLAEVSFRITKDVKFARLKAHNISDLLRIAMDKSEYYSMRCVDAANNALHPWLKNQNSRYLPKESSIEPSKIISIDADNYLVPSQSQIEGYHEVNVKKRECSCYYGMLKGPCKHKNAVAKLKNLPNFDVAPCNNPKMQALYMFLGTGKEVSGSWFEPLRPKNSSSMDISGQPNSLSEISKSSLDIPTCSDSEPILLEENIHSETKEICEDGESVKNASKDQDGTLGIEPVDGDIAHEDGDATVKSPDRNQKNLEEENMDRVNSLKEKFSACLQEFQKEVNEGIERDTEGYEKSIASFAKSMGSLPRSDSGIQKVLFEFGKSSAVKLKSGKKKFYIPVQSNSRARRTFTLRGSRAVDPGRPKLGVKKARTTEKHYLLSSVLKNKSASRKH